MPLRVLLLAVLALAACAPVADVCDEFCTVACRRMKECQVGDTSDGCFAACKREVPPQDCEPSISVVQQRDCADLGHTIECAHYCEAVCEAGLGCGTLFDANACMSGCQSTPLRCDVDAVAGLECAELSQEVLCYQARGAPHLASLCSLCTTDADCAATGRPLCRGGQCVYCSEADCPGQHCDPSRGCIECSTNTDCLPTHLCYYERCLERCTDDSQCPNAACTSDHCTDPVGTACAQSGVTCGGGSCIDVSYADLTTSSYCTRFCSDYTPCPAGFGCVDTECRRY